jgi:predicted transcriptional regulator
MNTSFKSIDDLLSYVTDNTDEIIESISKEEINSIEELEEFLKDMVNLGLLKIVGQDEDGNDLYEAV